MPRWLTKIAQIAGEPVVDAAGTLLAVRPLLGECRLTQRILMQPRLQVVK
jgi:hypothetical protein